MPSNVVLPTWEGDIITFITHALWVLEIFFLKIGLSII